MWHYVWTLHHNPTTQRFCPAILNDPFVPKKVTRNSDPWLVGSLGWDPVKFNWKKTYRNTYMYLPFNRGKTKHLLKLPNAERTENFLSTEISDQEGLEFGRIKFFTSCHLPLSEFQIEWNTKKLCIFTLITSLVKPPNSVWKFIWNLRFQAFSFAHKTSHSNSNRRPTTINS